MTRYPMKCLSLQMKKKFHTKINLQNLKKKALDNKNK